MTSFIEGFKDFNERKMTYSYFWFCMIQFLENNRKCLECKEEDLAVIADPEAGAVDRVDSATEDPSEEVTVAALEVAVIVEEALAEVATAVGSEVAE